MMFGCPRRKIGIVKQSNQPIRNRHDCVPMPVFHLGQPKIIMGQKQQEAIEKKDDFTMTLNLFYFYDGPIS